jgi:hypothetical protein
MLFLNFEFSILNSLTGLANSLSGGLAENPKFEIRNSKLSDGARS